jgi:hypothetical protein
MRTSVADPEPLNERLISLWTAALQVIEQPATTRHHAQQSAPGVMVLPMSLKVLRELTDSFGQKGNLNFR